MSSGGCAFVSELCTAKKPAFTANFKSNKEMPIFGSRWTGKISPMYNFDFAAPLPRPLVVFFPATKIRTPEQTGSEEHITSTGIPTFLEPPEIPDHVPAGARPIKHISTSRVMRSANHIDPAIRRKISPYHHSPSTNRYPVAGSASDCSEVSEDSSSDENETLDDVLRRALKAKRQAAARLRKRNE
ncbi:hypothetical protein DL98DRAFT_594872 [Cadophora sp. DSE1049]|nr:hypothetical protein DL98DRAFT_594872 [Cadophora sp. DSE1049]